VRSGDSEEDGIPNFTMMFATWLEGVNMSSSSNTCNNGKRKERECSEVQVGKKKVLELGCNYCYGGIKWLTACQTIVIQHLSIEIGKDVVFLRL
jgi:hypothetical protein